MGGDGHLPPTFGISRRYVNRVWPPLATCQDGVDMVLGQMVSTRKGRGSKTEAVMRTFPGGEKRRFIRRGKAPPQPA